MTQPNSAGPGRTVCEPSARGPGEARLDDWRATTLDADLDEPRRAVRAALGAALATPAGPGLPSSALLAAAQLAINHALTLALDRIYHELGASRPPIGAVADDLARRSPAAWSLVRRVLTAPDPRAGYVFLEDLLARLGTFKAVGSPAGVGAAGQ